MSNIIKTWDSQAIRIRSDRYVSLTDMAKSVGKQLGHWNALESTKSYLATLSAVIGIPITGLVEINQGGVPESQGTWGHPKVALRFAQWCSDDFAVQVDTWIDELVTTGKVELRPSEKSDRLQVLELKLELEKERNRGKELEINLVALRGGGKAKASSKNVKNVEAPEENDQLSGLLLEIWNRAKAKGSISTREVQRSFDHRKFKGRLINAAIALEILKHLEKMGCGKLEGKTLVAAVGVTEGQQVLEFVQRKI